MNEEVKNSSNEVTSNNQFGINMSNDTNMYQSGEEVISTPQVESTSIETTDNQPVFGNSVPPVSEFNSELNVDTPEPISVGLENVTPKIPEKNTEFEDFRNKKSKKGLIIALIILVIIVLGAIFGIKYFLSQNTAEKFLEHNIEKVTTSINNVINNNTSELKDIYKNDLISNTSLKLTTNVKSLKTYNNIELSLKININLNDNYADIDAALKQNTASLDGTLVLTSDKFYLDSEDIFNKMIYTDMEEDYFKIIKKYLEEDEDTLSTSDIKELITNLGKYLNDALKKANMTTKYNGLTVTYTYEINDNNKEDIIKSFENSLKGDKIINKLGGESITLDDIYLDNIKVELTLNIIDHKLESGLVTTDDSQIIIEKDEDNKYKIKEKDNNEEYIEIDTSGDTITLKYFADGSLVETINFKNTDKEFILVFSGDEINMNLTITNGEKKNIKFEIKYEGFVINLDMNMKLEDNSQVLDGSVSVKMNDESIKVTFETDNKWGDKLFTKKNTSNAYSLDNLTSDEQTEILSNALTKVTEFPFYSDLSSLFTPSYDDDDYYDYYDNYDDNEYYYGF